VAIFCLASRVVQYNKSLSNLNKLNSLSLSHCVPTECVLVLFLCIFAEHFFVNCGFWDMPTVRVLLCFWDVCAALSVRVWWMVRYRDKYSITADTVLPSALHTQKPQIILLFDCCPSHTQPHTLPLSPHSQHNYHYCAPDTHKLTGTQRHTRPETLTCIHTPLGSLTKIRTRRHDLQNMDACTNTDSLHSFL